VSYRRKGMTKKAKDPAWGKLNVEYSRPRDEEHLPSVGGRIDEGNNKRRRGNVRSQPPEPSENRPGKLDGKKSNSNWLWTGRGGQKSKKRGSESTSGEFKRGISRFGVPRQCRGQMERWQGRTRNRRRSARRYAKGDTHSCRDRKKRVAAVLALRHRAPPTELQK